MLTETPDSLYFPQCATSVMYYRTTHNVSARVDVAGFVNCLMSSVFSLYIDVKEELKCLNPVNNVVLLRAMLSSRFSASNE